MSLFPRTSLALVLILAAAAIGATAGASGSSAGVKAARSCGSYHKGSVYIIGLHTKRASCKTGRRVANAFTKCRHKHGARGHCHHRVLHFKCKENRGQSSPVQYDSSVHCSRGGKRVRFQYSQNT
jgi:hypothetical protein